MSLDLTMQSSKQNEVTFEYARGMYARTGFCHHWVKFQTESQIPHTDIVITNCGICAKEIDRKYV